MPEIGYALSSEEHGPDTLVENARRAEAAGFDFAMVSDHYHPWTTRQGNAPFVWNVLGGVARATDDIRVGTGVTCPIVRVHPAIVAQAAATTAAMFDGRFFLGVGTGENLNEHVLGDRWPPHGVRLEMLEEAVHVMQALWRGDELDHHGDHYTVENARLFTLPGTPPDVAVAAAGVRTATAAGRFGDALIDTSPDGAVVDRFEAAHGGDPPTYGQATVCWAESESEAVETAHEWWPNVALPGELGQELPTPAHFEQAVGVLSPEDVADSMVCSPDAADHIESIETYADAGYDHVYVHQVGPEQEAFLDFYEEQVLPSFS